MTLPTPSQYHPAAALRMSGKYGIQLQDDLFSNFGDEYPIKQWKLPLSPDTIYKICG
jgi:hypothetical protein